MSKLFSMLLAISLLLSGAALAAEADDAHSAAVEQSMYPSSETPNRDPQSEIDPEKLQKTAEKVQENLRGLFGNSPHPVGEVFSSMPNYPVESTRRPGN